MVKAWTPSFDPLKDEIRTTPVWVRISNIPVNFYHDEILLVLARGLGTPVKVDQTTLNFERARFARVCVEVNLSKPLKDTVKINGERYYVAYEGLSQICSGCGVYGHLVHNCPRRVVERVVEKEVPVVPVTETGVQPVGDGFTMVRRKGRTAVPPVNTVNPTAGSSKVQSGRNLREISGDINMANIAVSNSFGNLREEMISEDLREVGISEEGNKENENILARSNKGKSVS